MSISATKFARQNMVNLKFSSSELTIAQLATVIVFFLHFGSYYGVVAHWEGDDVDKFIVTYYDKNVHLLFSTMTTPNSVRFIYIFRGLLRIKDQFRVIRFDSWTRQINPNDYYTCVDILNQNVYEVLGANIMDYHLYNMRPLTKHDPEYIDPTLQTV